MLRPNTSPKRRPPHTLHTILKHGSTSLRKPEAHKRLRLKIELSTTRYCPVIGLLGKVAEVATRYVIEQEKSAFKRRTFGCHNPQTMMRSLLGPVRAADYSQWPLRSTAGKRP